MSPETDPLAAAVAPRRVVTALQPVVPVVRPRLRALCGAPAAGGLCHLPSRHAAGHLPPPARIVREFYYAY